MADLPVTVVLPFGERARGRGQGGASYVATPVKHTGPAPEGAFLGTGTVTVVTPLRLDPEKKRPVLTLDDMRSGQRLEELAKSFGLAIASDNVTIDGQINLNRPNLVVVCGPRMSEAMQTAYDTDPVIRWQRGKIYDDATAALWRFR